MDEEMSFSMSLSLDSDGFLRQECPTCEREFKVLYTEGEAEATPAPEGGYYCPYCAVQAPPGAWLTKDQAEQATRIVAQEALPQILEGFQQGMERATRHSKNVTYERGSGEIDSPEPRDDLTEDDDMTRVDFSCHPEEPVKVLDDWNGAVYCLMCGTTA